MHDLSIIVVTNNGFMGLILVSLTTIWQIFLISKEVTLIFTYKVHIFIDID